jgi:hypothetical protein
MSASLASAELPAARPTRSPWVILSVLCLGLFIILLHGTIVNIAILQIQGYFLTSFGNIEWVMNAYILAFAVLLVTLGSLACGLARASIC